MKLKDEDIKFLEFMKEKHYGQFPLHRNLMSADEIKSAERLVKAGKLIKGTSIESAKLKIYYVDND